MAKRITVQEKQDRIRALEEGLETNDEEIIKLLTDTIHQDELGIEVIIRDEGEITAIKDFLYEIEDSYLSKRNLKEIYYYKELPSDDWEFLSIEEKAVLHNTINYLKTLQVEYHVDKADLMSLRKEIDDFIKNRLKKINQTADVSNEVNYIMNNYSYADTIRNLGFSPSMGDDGFVVMTPYRLNPDKMTLEIKDQ